MPVLPITNILRFSVPDAIRISTHDDSTFTNPLPTSSSGFTLNALGVAGFFGGDSAVNGMATANLVPYRRWFGWYNTPGSYEIAKKFGPLADWAMSDGLFPGGEHDPTKLFGIHGKEGPPFIAVHSGSNFPHTQHPAYLMMKKTRSLPPTRHTNIDGRRTIRTTVTIVNLRHVPNVTERPLLPFSWDYSALLALVPIIVSVLGCAGCIFVADWFCLASIALGIVANGLSCFVIGSGNLTFEHHEPAEKAPPGDGVLKGDSDVVLLIGREGAINAFVRGRFTLQFREHVKERPGPRRGEERSPEMVQSYTNRRQQPKRFVPPQGAIGPCAILLIVQFLSQLLLIPQGTLFGQIMFVATLGASWLYNVFLSSIDREGIQTRILFDVLKIDEEKDIQKYELNTWTETTAFTCLVLAWVNHIKAPSELLDGMLPNNTLVWRAWKETMARKLRSQALFRRNTGFNFTDEDWEGDGLDPADRDLLQTFLTDSENAWKAWTAVRDTPQMKGLRPLVGGNA
ncbi:hypothetical protein BD311DRAFT_760447 [Dichomitus squalens]|uniref:Uncharacterized protein n=3 Tax=Dichomitus squalens TaxID=114155 RepID=A0A4V2K044_9APHY|nr:hypothetical protein BD311DRAFT_760447 [Dichomitus squalens]